MHVYLGIPVRQSTVQTVCICADGTVIAGGCA
jgi:hypothetical protein